MIPKYMEVFDYYVWEGFLEPQTVALLANNLQIARTADETANWLSDEEKQTYFGDGMVPNSWSYYSHPASEGLLLLLKPGYELLVGAELHPCFTYTRIMYQGAKMDRHTDRASCEYSATCCIAQTTPYPIWIEENGVAKKIILNPGDVLFYRGTRLPHWRDEYEGPEHIQVFCHFVSAQGPYAAARYDTKPALGLSSNFKNYIIMNELDGIADGEDPTDSRIEER